MAATGYSSDLKILHVQYTAVFAAPPPSDNKKIKNLSPCPMGSENHNLRTVQQYTMHIITFSLPSTTESTEENT